MVRWRLRLEVGTGQAVKKATSCVQRLAWKTWHNKESLPTNLAFSPLSLHASLTLLTSAAVGSTLEQIVAFLSPAGADAHTTVVSKVVSWVLACRRNDGWKPEARYAMAIWVEVSRKDGWSWTRLIRFWRNSASTGADTPVADGLGSCGGGEAMGAVP
ncbi:hypothetical protein E2562_006184 [Oryza meyeriana var. granulata]|uniref:Uncharacterized protein n=1 Tax=Oryza meyeriana var. granulata TaxID=110450 RepID=A0A6G1CPG3_9ORYZ|nr:hypothetical protein E2562_006184 [Oryza meyeriana var. granulata]